MQLTLTNILTALVPPGRTLADYPEMLRASGAELEEAFRVRTAKEDAENAKALRMRNKRVSARNGPAPIPFACRDGHWPGRDLPIQVQVVRSLQRRHEFPAQRLYIYAGTKVRLQLLLKEGFAAKIIGESARCELIRGRVHLVGIRFDAPADAITMDRLIGGAAMGAVAAGAPSVAQAAAAAGRG